MTVYRVDSVDTVVDTVVTTFRADSTGTVVDTGVMAPALTFRSIFEEEGVSVTDAEAREPMGMHKRVRSSGMQGQSLAGAENLC